MLWTSIFIKFVKMITLIWNYFFLALFGLVIFGALFPVHSLSGEPKFFCPNSNVPFQKLKKKIGGGASDRNLWSNYIFHLGRVLSSLIVELLQIFDSMAFHWFLFIGISGLWVQTNFLHRLKCIICFSILFDCKKKIVH